jgi:hypothetical protein
VAIAIAGLLAACSGPPTTSAAASSTTTVHGTVRSGSSALVGARVGFWSRTGHTIVTATTGTGGAFTLRVPSGIRGFVYAGVKPDATKAVFSVGGRSYVRGIVGATQATATSYRLYQGHASATAANLAGGAALRFDLQKPGRIRVDGRSYLRSKDGSLGTVELLRLNGGRADLPIPDSAGVFTSGPLVPGAYKIYSFPVTPYLPRTIPVTVRAGATTTISPSFLSGATVRGIVTSGGRPAVGVPVLVVQGASVRRSAVTDSKGHYAMSVLAPGDYGLRIGYNVQPNPVDLEPDFDAAPPTSDDFLPTTRVFSVGAARAPVTVDASVLPAGHVSGTVAGLGGAEFGRVWLEDATHAIVRTRGTGPAPARAYRLGGLVPGKTYTVYSATDSKYGTATFTAIAGTVRRSVTVNKATLTLRGVAAGAARGTVSLNAQGPALPRFGRGGKVDTANHYVVRGLLPAAYTVRVTPADLRVRLASRAQRLTLTASISKDLAAGPRPGVYTARFVSGAAPVTTGNSELGGASSAAGGRATFSTGADGRARIDTLQPGVYRYQPTWPFAVPAIDGPWWFGAPSGGFTISSGRTTDVGTVALHVHAR